MTSIHQGQGKCVVKICEAVFVHIHFCWYVLFSFTVPSENKKDQRSIEQTLADIQSKKKLKTSHDAQNNANKMW